MQTNAIRTLNNHRDLLLAWTVRTLRARYQQSVLGGLWAVIQPAASVAIFSVIFTLFVPIDTGGVPYVVFSYVAMVPWTLFSTSITDMVDSLVSNMNLVSKIYFPREILPVAALLARLVDFLIASGVAVFLIIFYRVPVSWTLLPLLPVVLATQLALSLGVGFLGSALNVFYRDMKHLFILGLQLWFYASPIIYPVATVPERFRSLYYLNPMAGVIDAYRTILFGGSFPVRPMLISAILSLFILVIGYWFFKRVELQFADVV
jgi:lipopolysaccharide transport system permease protein